MAAGNWVPELVGMANAKDQFGKVGEHSPWLQWDDLEASHPDAIVVLPCGYEISRTRREISTLTARSEWSQLEAVRGNRVILTDGHHYFNRPGPRLVESLEILAESLHPDVFHFGHEGRGWEYL
jgi:iron complex transport system substrate-binding protein